MTTVTAEILQDYASERGWTPATMFDVLCQYVDQVHNDRIHHQIGGTPTQSDFRKFLDGIVAEEDAALP